MSNIGESCCRTTSTAKTKKINNIVHAKMVSEMQKVLDKSDDMMEAINVDIEIGRRTSNDDNDYKL